MVANHRKRNEKPQTCGFFYGLTSPATQCVTGQSRPNKDFAQILSREVWSGIEGKIT